MRLRIPFITLIVVSLSLLVYLLPANAFLAYDRHAILAGEWWRVVTGHWVHFSAQHFLYDTAAFGIAGWMIESRNHRNFGRLCGLATLVISAAMLLCNPQLQICGGLSGLATAAVVFLALNGLEESGAWRWICGMALFLCAAKLIAEERTGRFLVLHAPTGFAPVPSNHIAGALAALAVYAWPKLVALSRRSAAKAERHFGNSVSDNVFPSGSLNHAIFPPTGEVHTPNSSCGNPGNRSNRTPFFVNS
jgi:rhomboid family GlyGly-CTERM serine protease